MSAAWRCATCRWWRPKRYPLAEHPDWAYCDRAEAPGALWELDDPYIGFVTAPNFGCVHWEARP